MTRGFVKYRKGYNKILSEDYESKTAIRPYAPVELPHMSLTMDGVLTLRERYASDGASGPAIDTDSLIRGAFAHDAKYQLIRLGLVPRESKAIADNELYADCIEDGMWRARAAWIWWGVHRGGIGATRPSHEPMVYSAP